MSAAHPEFDASGLPINEAPETFDGGLLGMTDSDALTLTTVGDLEGRAAAYYGLRELPHRWFTVEDVDDNMSPSQLTDLAHYAANHVAAHSAQEPSALVGTYRTMVQSRIRSEYKATTGIHHEVASTMLDILMNLPDVEVE